MLSECTLHISMIMKVMMMMMMMMMMMTIIICILGPGIKQVCKSSEPRSQIRRVKGA